MKKTSTQELNQMPAKTSKSKVFTSILFAFSAIMISGLPVFASAQMMTQTAQTIQTTQIMTQTTSTSTEGAPLISWPTIVAKSAFIYNPVSNKIIYEKNADVQRPLASLLKIMTATTADNLLAISPSLANKKLTIPKMKDATPVDFSLPTGSTWLPDPLIEIMLLGSSNKAAETIASQLIPRSSFISLMNFNAKRMGLSQTYFKNPSGLTEIVPTTRKSSMQIQAMANSTSTEGQLDIAGGVSTAREVAKMMWTVIAQNPGLLNITRVESLTIPTPKSATNKTGTTIISNTNKLLKDFPIVFGKTGFTQNAGGNLAIVMQKSETSEPYVIVVLDSTADARFEDTAKLASTTLELIAISSKLSTTTAMAQ